MKKIKIHNLWLVYFTVLVCINVTVQAAQSCEMVYNDANEVLLKIEKDLEKITTKQQYQQSVKQRFEKVEKLLLASENCIKPETMASEFLENWQQMYMTLTALQASAQLSAFSEFNNWLESKEKDLTAFEYAHSAQWRW